MEKIEEDSGDQTPQRRNKSFSTTSECKQILKTQPILTLPLHYGVIPYIPDELNILSNLFFFVDWVNQQYVA